MYKRSQVFAAACMSLFIFGMTVITLGSLMPSLIEKFGAAELNDSILVSVLPIGMLAGSFIFGPIADRYGYKMLLIISITISAIALEGIAFTESPFILYACIFFIGFGGGIINGGGSALVSDISEENKGANLSILGVFFGIGALGMPLLLGVLSKYFHYPVILSAVGLFMLLPVFYSLFIVFPVAKQKDGIPVKEALKLLKEPALLLTCFLLFFQSGTEALINNWTTTFIQFKVNTTPEKALYALSISLTGLTAARLLLGWLLKRISSFIVFIVSILLIVTGSLILYSTHSYPLSFTALILCGLGLAAGFPVTLGYVGQLYTRLSGTAFSIAFVFAVIGNTIISYTCGFIKAKYSIGYLPLLVIVCVFCMAILLLVIKKKIGNRIKM